MPHTPRTSPSPSPAYAYAYAYAEADNATASPGEKLSAQTLTDGPLTAADWAILYGASNAVPKARMAALRQLVGEWLAMATAAAAHLPAMERRSAVKAYLARLHELRLESMSPAAWQPEVLGWLQQQERFIEQASR